MSWMCTLWPRPLMFLKSPKWSISVNYSFFMSKYPRISGITRSYHLYDFFDAIMCKKCVKTFPNLIKTNQMQQRTFLVPLILSALSHCHSGKFRQMEKYFKFLIGDTLIFWRAADWAQFEIWKFVRFSESLKPMIVLSNIDCSITLKRKQLFEKKLIAQLL